MVGSKPWYNAVLAGVGLPRFTSTNMSRLQTFTLTQSKPGTAAPRENKLKMEEED